MFYRYNIILPYQLRRQLLGHIPPLVPDMLMTSGDLDPGFRPTPAALLLSGQLTLEPCQFLLRLPQIPMVRISVAVRRDSEVFPDLSDTEIWPFVL